MFIETNQVGSFSTTLLFPQWTNLRSERPRYGCRRCRVQRASTPNHDTVPIYIAVIPYGNSFVELGLRRHANRSTVAAVEGGRLINKVIYRQRPAERLFLFASLTRHLPSVVDYGWRRAADFDDCTHHRACQRSHGDNEQWRSDASRGLRSPARSGPDTPSMSASDIANK